MARSRTRVPGSPAILRALVRERTSSETQLMGSIQLLAAVCTTDWCKATATKKRRKLTNQQFMSHEEAHRSAAHRTESESSSVSKHAFESNNTIIESSTHDDVVRARVSHDQWHRQGLLGMLSFHQS